ncbi:hypothetical protein DSO57_1007967 [Entomophthora muscae]|uniref:Uncharacterized protein n=1 Tax=Entomophthora muscae TaxID=34485 RepID=A0ACC2TID3_9FUNG|nr:hypothetical protein DSO57_1007967 [Entomophthora muscae]
MVKQQDSASQAPDSGLKVLKSEVAISKGALKDVKPLTNELPKGAQNSSDTSSLDLTGAVSDGILDLDTVSDTTPKVPLPPKKDSVKADADSGSSRKVSDIDLSLEEEKRRRRAERFGTAASSTTPPKTVATKPLSVEEELEKRRKRAERFNTMKESSPTTSTTPTPDIGKNLAPSLKALSAIDEKEKLRLRAERFGIVSSSSSKKSKRKVLGSENPKKATSNSIATAPTEEKKKLEARAKRFKPNSTVTSTPTFVLSPEDSAKLAKRAERFGINKS